MKWPREPFLKAYLLAAMLYGALQVYPKQLDLVLWLNKFHNAFLDFFFSTINYFGDGWVIVGVGIAFLFLSRHLGISVLVSYALSSGFTQLLKRTVFAHMHRPLWYIEELHIRNFHLPDGAEIVYNNSFPSGHSTTAFAFFAILAFFQPRLPLKLLFLMLACLTALARVYLVQHFPIDTLAGSAIGVGFSWLAYKWLITDGRLNRILEKRKNA